MLDKAKQSAKRQNQPFDLGYPNHPDHTSDKPCGIQSGAVAGFALDRQSTAEQEHERSLRAEQQLHQQQREQNERCAFQEGSAQAHQQGSKQH